MCGSMVDIQSATTEIGQHWTEANKKMKPQGKNIMAYRITYGGHNECSLTMAMIMSIGLQ